MGTKKSWSQEAEPDKEKNNLHRANSGVSLATVFCRCKQRISGKSAGAKFCFFLKIVSLFMTALAVAALLAVILYILLNGVDKITFSLLFGDGSDGPSILPAMLGTLALIALSALIAVPVGIGSAIFLVEYTNQKGTFVKFVRLATETLAGIPSIVYGLFGYLVFVVTFGMGYTLLGGAVTLAIMILPVIVRSTEESLLAVPKGLREGAYALGTGKVRTIFRVVLPSCAGGIVSAIILAVGRVISESAVLILTVGMVVDKLPNSLLSPGTSLALDIYYFGSHGYPDEAAATSVILMLLVVCINLLASAVGKWIARKTKGA